MADKHLGQLSFVRIYSGTIKVGFVRLQPDQRDTRERVGRLMRMHANKREDIEDASAGEIIAIGGMKQVTTGDTVCDENKPIILESDGVSRAGYSRRGRTEDPRRIRTSWAWRLNRLAQEDPSFNVSTDHETGQTIIAGMGELHLEIIVDRMKREFGVEANVGKPQVAYRETITQPAPGKEIYKKQTGGRGQFGTSSSRSSRLRAKALCSRTRLPAARFRKEFIKPVEQGIQDAMERGFLAGYELVDIKVRLVVR